MSWQLGLLLARGRRREGRELAVWFPPVLAERAHSEGARPMRAVGGNQTALVKERWRAVGGDQPAARKN